MRTKLRNQTNAQAHNQIIGNLTKFSTLTVLVLLLK